MTAGTPEKVTIKTATKDHDWQTSAGHDLSCWNLSLELADGRTIDGQINTKPGNTPGNVGDTIDVEISQNAQGYYKFKKHFANTGSGGGGGGYSRDPSDVAGMARAHAQEMAVRWAVLAHARGALPEAFTRNDLVEIIDWFDNDTKSAVAAVKAKEAADANAAQATNGVSTGPPPPLPTGTTNQVEAPPVNDGLPAETPSGDPDQSDVPF